MPIIGYKRRPGLMKDRERRGERERKLEVWSPECGGRMSEENILKGFNEPKRFFLVEHVQRSRFSRTITQRRVFIS